MSTTLKIAETARRSGFTASTLRYYEDIGLMPPPVRTEAGYRCYDEEALARLSFIARAKQLGCSLDEITDLLAAWEGPQCAPVQTRLRDLVANKIKDGQRQMTELAAFTAQLRRGLAGLGQHTPDGPCDEQCGCSAADDSASGAPVTAVALTSRAAAGSDMAIACTLGLEEIQARLGDWQGCSRSFTSARPSIRESVSFSGAMRPSARSPSSLQPSSDVASFSRSRSPSTRSVSRSRSEPPRLLSIS